MIHKIKSLANFKAGNPSILAGLTEDYIKEGFRALNEQLGKNAQLKKEKRQIRIICSGGACAVVYLKTRSTTKDIDFYTPIADDSREVSYARNKLDMSDARSRARYPDGWINCEMGAHVNNFRGCETLFANSVNNGALLYKGEHLVVYAADWKFQFVGKVKRAFDNLECAQEDGRNWTNTNNLTFLGADKDFGGAIDFLHQILQTRKAPLALADIRTWYNYGYFITPEMAQAVNLCYAGRFGDDARRFERERVISI